MFEDEVVKKRKWMTHEHFLDLVGATNLIWRTILIALVSLSIAFGFKKINSAFIVAGGSVAGFLLTLI
jgi:chromate transporter